MILWGNGGDRFKLFDFFLTQRRRAAERDTKRDYRLL